MRRLLELVVVAAMLARAALPAVALARPAAGKAAIGKAGKGLEIRFEVRARDSVVGKGRIVVGPRQAGERHGTRAVTLEGRSEDLAGVLYQGESVATSWLDGDWRPVAARWHSEFLRRQSATVASYLGHHVIADFKRGDRTVHVDRELDEAPQDLVSLVPWLMQQKVKRGTQLGGSIYLGADVCRFDATVRAAERQETIRGTRQALPVDVTFGQCRVKRTFTVWLDAVDWTPWRIRVAESALGSVDMVLTGVGPVEAAWPVLPEPVRAVAR